MSAIPLPSQRGLKKSLPSPQIKVGAVMTHSSSGLELGKLLEENWQASWSVGHTLLHYTENLPGHILSRRQAALSYDAPAGLW